MAKVVIIGRGRLCAGPHGEHANAGMDEGPRRRLPRRRGDPAAGASHEYASLIIEARFTGTRFASNGNVMNHGSITNLSERCCVEVPCLADAEGIHPTWVGALPAQCAALNMSNVAVQELAVQAVLERDREAPFHACALDPLTAAVVAAAANPGDV